MHFENCGHLILPFVMVGQYARHFYLQPWRQLNPGDTPIIWRWRGCKPGGYSHVKAYGDVPPKWVAFSPKILRHGSHFKKKKSLEEGPISKNLWKNCKISRFWGRKILRNGSQFAKISKKLSIQPFFEWKKSLDMGRVFRPRAAHSVKK